MNFGLFVWMPFSKTIAPIDLIFLHKKQARVLRPKHVTVATTNNGAIQLCVSVHKCKHQLLDQFLANLANSFPYGAV